MRLCFILLLSAIALLSIGCADFKSYMRDRGNDLADCFTARTGLAYGFGARVQATNYVGASVGFSMWEKKRGIYGRNAFAQYPTLMESDGWAGVPFTQVMAFVMPFADPHSEERWYQKLDGFVCLLLATDVRRSEEKLPEAFSILGLNVGEFTDIEAVNFKSKRIDPSIPFLREKFFIELGVTLFGGGFDIGFNPVEFVDFLLGWTTLDITGDDKVPEAEQEAKP